MVCVGTASSVTTAACSPSKANSVTLSINTRIVARRVWACCGGGAGKMVMDDVRGSYIGRAAAHMHIRSDVP